MNFADDTNGSSCAHESADSPPAGYIASNDLAFSYKAAGGKNFLRKFDLFESGNHFYILGRDPRRNRVRLLTIDRNPDEIRDRQSVTLVKLAEGLSQYNGCKGEVMGSRNAQREWRVDFQPHVGNSRSSLWLKESNLSVNATMFKSEEIQVDRVEALLAIYRDDNLKLSFWKKHNGFAGLIGFAEFTEGNYLVGVRKKEVVARICGSEVFSVANSFLLPFRNGSEPSVTEQRYRSLFRSFDMSRGFYISYDYDLSRSLQSNMGGKPQPLQTQASATDWGISHTFDEKFVWNFHLLRNFPPEHHCWAVYLMHGYVEQHRLSIGFNRVISLTLLARRSRHFAGTRYRKRGISMQGHCANEVETEQIIIDESQGSSSGGHCFTSFLQLRASIPLFWSQPTELNFKPDVVLHSFDPLFHVTSIHLSQLLRRYGSPIHVLNLIKGSQESKPRESLLNDRLETAIESLNAGISNPLHRIGYTHFDFHQKHKLDSVGVFEELRRETEAVVNRTGIFHSGMNRWATSNPQDPPVAMCMQQQGVLRSNCIDCLDRTNVAQFYAGVKAMSLQLQALGISNTPVPMESDLPRLLMDLYSRMGNELALQYVGSVAHDKMGGTGKTTSIGLRTFSKLVVSAQRYISNTFTDIEKQQAIDVFLGTFIPRLHPTWEPIWNADDLSFCWSDKTNLPQYAPLRRNRPPDSWWRDPLTRFHSGYYMGLCVAEAWPMELQAAPEFSQKKDSNRCTGSIQSHKCTRTFEMMLTGIDANFDRTHAKGKYVSFEPLLDPKDPAQEKRHSTVDDGDDDTTVIFAEEFSMLNRECGKPQRLQAFPTTDSSGLQFASRLANLFTQRSLVGTETSSQQDLFPKISLLETTVTSTEEHGLLKPPNYIDPDALSDFYYEHANPSLKQHIIPPQDAFHLIDIGLLNPTPRRDFSDAMAELFAPENTLGLEETENTSGLEDTDRLYQFINDDQNSADFTAMKTFLNCSQDWEQLCFLSGAPPGITVRAPVCCSRIEASRCLRCMQVRLRDRDDGGKRDDGSGTQTKKRAVITSYRPEALNCPSDIQIGDEISSIMVMGKNCEYDGLDLNELLSEEFGVQPAYDRIMRILHGCSGTQVCTTSAHPTSSLCHPMILTGYPPRVSPPASQVVVSIVRAGQSLGHVCLVRDGSFEYSTNAAPNLDWDGMGRHGSFSI